MLVKDEIEYGCVECLIDEQQAQQSELMSQVVASAISEEIRKGNLTQTP